MPNSCKCILDRMVHKGAMTEEERDKILRNLKGIEVQKILSDLWDAGVNMGGEYQGVWVRFKDIEKVFDKYTKEGAE